MTRGLFITFEGGEGSGKSTQAARLAAHLRERGLAVVLTREPGGSPGAEAIRKLLVEGDTARWTGRGELFLHFAARADHVERVIQPALARGACVVCDRFTDSTMAYQGYAHGLGREAVERLADVCHPGLKPDITFLLDIPVEVGMKRSGLRDSAENRYERMPLEFHERIRNAFLDIASRDAERIRLIDASADISALEKIIRLNVDEMLVKHSGA
ncbi:MAG: dTMP kinase [Azospirillaceae bacterium]